MLSVGKLGVGAGGYYTAMVADGAEEYFTGDREAPGVWVGSGSDDLGLVGTVGAEDFASVLEHRFPGTNVRMTGSRSVPRVAGFDATFCAPKSVSVLHALGTPEVRTAVRRAHDVAVVAALSVLEDEASRGRRGRGGVEVVDGNGYVAAAFRHRTSRAGDPHLHTHVVIANLVQGPDDRWTALDARPMYHWSKTVGCLYEAQLRHELGRTLGVQWRPVRRGIADAAVVPMQVIDEFSTRRHEIEAHLAGSGFDSARSAQIATYATRRMKDLSATPATLVEGWRARAGRLGFDCEHASQHLASDRERPRDAVDVEAMFDRLAGPDGLTRNRATFGRREIIMGICDLLPDGAPIGEICEWSELFIESDRCIRLFGDRSARIRTRDGRVVSARTDEVRFSTPDMITAERHLVGSAVRRVNAHAGVADRRHVSAAIEARPLMSVEQTDMVWRICTGGSGVEVVEGVAGAGKTYALAAANQAWTASGQRVIGCSLAAKAARQLQSDAAIASLTIDRLLIDLDRAEWGGLGADTVVVVDEAAMVGTRKLLRLLFHAELANAKVVLVGDPCQLPEIEAGGGFVGLADRLGRAALRTNRRQTNQWERDALALIRQGHTNQAIDAYVRHGRVTTGRTAIEAARCMVDDWAAARGTQSAVMLAARRTDVALLNTVGRARLQADGVIGPDQVTINGLGYSSGDLVLALRNDRCLDVLNGTRAVIEQVDIDNRRFRCRTEDLEALDIPFRYAQDGHLTYAYAMTIHKSQGATFDRSFILAGDQLTKESVYTALSRGSETNDLYVVGPERDLDAHTSPHDPDPLDSLRDSVRRSGAQTMAIDDIIELVRQRLRDGPAAPPSPTIEIEGMDAGIEL